jgi:hypothetical protein
MNLSIHRKSNLVKYKKGDMLTDSLSILNRYVE